MLNTRLAAAIYEGLKVKKQDSLYMNLQYCIARSTICRLVLLSYLSSPNSRRNLSRNWMDETERRLKSSVRITFSSRSISIYFLRTIEYCSLTRSTMRTKDGDMFSSSFAAIRRQTVAKEMRSGRLRLWSLILESCLSARLIAV